MDCCNKNWGLLGWDVHDSLALGSALGGGLLVSGWFVLFTRRFPFPVAALATGSLAGMVVTWMTATKVITDPLAAGLLTLVLVFFDAAAPGDGEKDVRQSRLSLAAGGLAAAAAAGVRPQNFGVLLLVAVLAVLRVVRCGVANRRQAWALGLGGLLGGCLLWLVPVMFLQARAPGSHGYWFAYGNQVTGQWRWRLDQPNVYVGAPGQTGEQWLKRVDIHLLGWFTRGFGFILRKPHGWVGLGVIVAAWAMYVVAANRRHRLVERSGSEPAAGAASDGVDARLRGEFWRMHLPWAVVYVLMVFCCLPGDQRYYLPIFPLFVVVAVAGPWLCLRGVWRWTAAAVPLTLTLATLPLIGPNHRDEAPPLRLLRTLEARYPAAAERRGVWLILRDTYRHAQWYAPEFHTVKQQDFDPANPPEGFGEARAVYCDAPVLVNVWPGEKKKVGRFERSTLIYRKHNTVELFELGPLPK